MIIYHRFAEAVWDRMGIILVKAILSELLIYMLICWCAFLRLNWNGYIVNRVVCLEKVYVFMYYDTLILITFLLFAEVQICCLTYKITCLKVPLLRNSLLLTRFFRCNKTLIHLKGIFSRFKRVANLFKMSCRSSFVWVLC